MYTRDDYSDAIRLLMNDFAHPFPELAYMYIEEDDAYYVSVDDGFGILNIQWPGDIVRNALPLVKAGVRSWT